MKIMKKLIFILLLIIIPLTYSAILKWEKDCVKTNENPNPPDEGLCYHQVAMSYALVGNNDKATKFCIDIYKQEIFTKSQMNRCLRDVAVILKNKSICDLIDVGTEYNGKEEEEITQEKIICDEQVDAELEKNKKQEEGCISALGPFFVLMCSFFYKSFVH